MEIFLSDCHCLNVEEIVIILTAGTAMGIHHKRNMLLKNIDGATESFSFTSCLHQPLLVIKTLKCAFVLFEKNSTIYEIATDPERSPIMQGGTVIICHCKYVKYEIKKRSQTSSSQIYFFRNR